VDIIMKKTLIALSVLVASTAANAGIELYNQDDVSVTLGGDLEVVYLSEMTDDADTAGQDETDFRQELQDADFSFDVRYAATDDVSIGAFWEFSGDGGAADLGDAYFGLYTGMVTAKVGKTATILDDAGIGSDYQFGVKSFIDDVDFGGRETVKFQVDNGTVYGGIAYQGNDGKNTKNDLVDGNIGVRFSGLDLAVFYGTSDSADQDLMALEAKYAISSVNLELGYYDVDDVASTIAFAADYTYNKAKFAAGVSSVDPEGAADDYVHYFVNAGYSVAPSTTVYAEVGASDVDNTDTGVAVGIKAEF
jgi:predicted porin